MPPDPEPASSRLLVTVCTLNERENLEQLVPEILRYAPAAEVLVIDDNSRDGTGELADDLAAADSRVHVLHRRNERGLGTATLAGFHRAIDGDYDLVLNLDADFSHHPRFIPDILARIPRCDVAVGSRYVAGGRIEGWPLKRHLMSRCVNLYARWMLWLPLRDTSGSFRCYRVDKLRELDLSRVRGRGYAFQEEIVYRCRRIGCRFEETPIVFENRRSGVSKINIREAVTAVWVIFRLSIDNLLGVPVRAER